MYNLYCDKSIEILKLCEMCEIFVFSSKNIDETEKENFIDKADTELETFIKSALPTKLRI